MPCIANWEYTKYKWDWCKAQPKKVSCISKCNHTICQGFFITIYLCTKMYFILPEICMFKTFQILQKFATKDPTVQGVRIENCQKQIALELKRNTFDPVLVKPKRVYNAEDFSTFPNCLQFLAVCLQFFKNSTAS